MKLMKLRGKKGTSMIKLGVPFSEAGDLCEGRRVAVITDATVYGIYGESFPPGSVVTIGSGEMQKTLETVRDIYESLLSAELDRSSFIIGIGGGIVCDIAGFVGSTYMRGVPFGFVPTTLLAQVDAGIGGKNGVNFKGYKNIIGTFTQPRFVLCDFSLLKTLPGREVRNGFAEVIKHGLIADRELFGRLERDREAVLALREGAIEDVVHRSLRVKLAIVSRDEEEGGVRRKLNFGHTIGHAVEKTVGCSHGEAVSIGMAMEARLSMKRGILAAADVARIERILVGYGLPLSAEMDKEKIIDAVRKDKKREGEEIHCVFLTRIGDAVIERVRIQELEEVFDDLCEHC